jgi:hypothetical protein
MLNQPCEHGLVSEHNVDGWSRGLTPARYVELPLPSRLTLLRRSAPASSNSMANWSNNVPIAVAAALESDCKLPGLRSAGDVGMRSDQGVTMFEAHSASRG